MIVYTHIELGEPELNTRVLKMLTHPCAKYVDLALKWEISKFLEFKGNICWAMLRSIG